MSPTQRSLASVEIIVPGLVPISVNEETRGRSWRARAARRANLRTAWSWALTANCPTDGILQLRKWAHGAFEAGGTQPKPKRVLIHVSVYRAKRRLDPDNISLKALLDGMRDCGFIKNDSARWVKLEVDQPAVVKDEKDAHTRIRVAPLAGKELTEREIRA